eukprot:5776334-Heterocapsa_arctica.AAC.1
MFKVGKMVDDKSVFVTSKPLNRSGHNVITSHELKVCRGLAASFESNFKLVSISHPTPVAGVAKRIRNIICKQVLKRGSV